MAGTARPAYLDRLAALWIQHDPRPLVAEAGTELPEHDDREQPAWTSS